MEDEIDNSEIEPIPVNGVPVPAMTSLSIVSKARLRFDVGEYRGSVEPEYVICYRTHFRRRWKRVIRFLYRVVLAVALAFLFLALPDFALDALHTWKNPIVVFVLVCAIGKILVDTLFYDHFLP